MVPSQGWLNTVCYSCREVHKHALTVDVARSTACLRARQAKVYDLRRAASVGVVFRQAYSGAAHAAALTTPHYAARKTVGGLDPGDAIAARRGGGHAGGR